jgi:hypothetical protein
MEQIRKLGCLKILEIKRREEIHQEFNATCVRDITSYDVIIDGPVTCLECST